MLFEFITKTWVIEWGGNADPAFVLDIIDKEINEWVEGLTYVEEVRIKDTVMKPAAESSASPILRTVVLKRKAVAP